MREKSHTACDEADALHYDAIAVGIIRAVILDAPFNLIRSLLLLDLFGKILLHILLQRTVKIVWKEISVRVMVGGDNAVNGSYRQMRSL